MKKFFRNISKNVNVAGLICMLAAASAITVSSAFTSAETRADVRYGYDQTLMPGSRWIDITGGIKLGTEGPGQEPTYGCEVSENVCTATFPDTIDPNSENTEDPQAPNYVEPENVDEGDFYPIL